MKSIVIDKDFILELNNILDEIQESNGYLLNFENIKIINRGKDPDAKYEQFLIQRKVKKI